MKLKLGSLAVEYLLTVVFFARFKRLVSVLEITANNSFKPEGHLGRLLALLGQWGGDGSNGWYGLAWSPWDVLWLGIGRAAGTLSCFFGWRGVCWPHCRLALHRQLFRHSCLSTGVEA